MDELAAGGVVIVLLAAIGGYVLTRAMRVASRRRDRENKELRSLARSLRQRAGAAADGFDPDAEIFQVSGPYPTLREALDAATAYFEYLERAQPHEQSHGQKGVQDRVYLRHPDGHRQRLFC